MLEPLLEHFPTYPGPNEASTSKGHVIALAQVMEGMHGALRLAESAEQQAEAGGPTIP